MKTQEISSEEWQEFCEKFTEINRGSLLTIESIGSDGNRREVAKGLPLNRMTFDTTDACNDVITFSLESDPDQRKVNHFVIEPIHLRLRQSGEKGKFMEIGSENGVTLVSLQSGRFPEMQNASDKKPIAVPS